MSRILNRATPWVVALLLAAASGTSRADTVPDLTQVSSSDYLQARDWLVERAISDHDVTLALENMATQSASWEQAIYAEAVLSRARDPRWVASLEDPPVLQAGHYLKKRRPYPEVGSYLKRLNLPVALLMEAYLRADIIYEPNQANEFPPSMAASQIRTLQQAERAAFRQGLLQAMGASQDPATLPLLARVSRDPNNTPAERRMATWAMGQLPSPEVDGLLTELNQIFGRITAPAESDHLRTAVAGAAAQRFTGTALDLLHELAGDPRTAVRRAAIVGLGLFASPRRWRRSSDPAQRHQAVTILLKRFRSHFSPSTADAFRQALSTSGHERVKERLAAWQKDPTLSADQRAVAQAIHQSFLWRANRR